MSKTIPHPYADRQAFERLMLLIATCFSTQVWAVQNQIRPNPTQLDTTTPSKVQTRLQEVARFWRHRATDYATDTPQDLKPCVATASLTGRCIVGATTLALVLCVGTSCRLLLTPCQPNIKATHKPQIHRALTKRLRGLDLELNGQFYPVRQQMNHAIYTDLEEMMALGKTKTICFQVGRHIGSNQQRSGD